MPTGAVNQSSTIKGIVTFFWAASWIFAATMLLTIFVLRWWPGDRFIVVRMFNYSMPWFLVILLTQILVAGVAGRKWLVLALLPATVYIIFVNLPLFMPKNLPQTPSGFKLKVMSFNVWSHNNDMASIAEVISKAAPDILLIQELSKKKQHKIVDLINGIYKSDEGGFVYDSKTLLGTYSRYPITLLPIKTESSVQKAVIETTSGPVTIYNVHFLRTVLRDSHNWKKLHDEVTGLVLSEIANISGPVILGGDFNMTDQTQTYREISKTLKNAHREAGFGFGFTFPSSSRKIKGWMTLPPIVRIDHLFYNRNFYCSSAQTLDKSGGSDHLPVVSEFVLVNKPEP